MAATVISAYADDVTLNRPPLYKPLAPDRKDGRVRVASWKLTLASQVSGTSFAVCEIPSGARILGGIIAASATLANSATLAVGLAAVDGTGLIDNGTIPSPAGAAATGTALSDATTYLKAAAVQGATQVPFAITLALGYLYKTGKNLWVTLTTGVGTVATEVVIGDIRYVVD